MAANGQQRCTEDEFITLWKRLGGAAPLAKHLDMNERKVHSRRRAIEKRRGIILQSVHENSHDPNPISLPPDGFRIEEEIRGGVVVVASDCHWWPGQVSTAHKALVRLLKELQPAMLVLNGDLMDGARLCRQDPKGWEKSEAPTVKEEIEAVQERATELALAAGRKCRRRRTIENHDIRLERYLAMNASEVEGLPGTTLEYYIPEWETCWSINVNDNTMIKHRFHNGVHAGYNNALKSGRTVVTGHLHRLLVTPWADYNGCRWGVDTGTLSDIGPEVKAFRYDEDNSRPWSSGFAVLTYLKDGRLITPEIAQVIDGVCYFRGKAV